MVHTWPDETDELPLPHGEMAMEEPLREEWNYEFERGFKLQSSQTFIEQKYCYSST